MNAVYAFVGRFAALGAVLALLTCAADASATRPTVAKAVRGAGVDGGHLVAWAKADGRVVVLDDRTGARTPIVIAGGCEGAWVADGSDGRFLVQCNLRAGHPAWLVLNARSQKVIASGDANCEQFGSIGRHWLEGADTCSGHGAIIYRDWRDGQRFPSGGDLYGDPRRPYDLDTPYLDAIGSTQQTNFVVGMGRALAETRSGSADSPRYAIKLISDSKTRRIHRCQGHCQPISLRGGLALWSDGPGYANGYALGAKKRLDWWVPDRARLVGSTAHRVYYVTDRTGAGDLKSFAWRR